MKDYVNHFFSGLSDRDKVVLSFGGVVVLIYLFFLLIYSPLRHAVDFKLKQLTEKKETLIWMREQSKVKHAVKHIEGNLLSVFSSQLKKASFSQFPYQLQQSGENRIQLSFAEVPYVDFLNWLQSIGEQFVMTVTELSATRSKIPGVVKLRIVVAEKEKGAKT